MSDLNKTSPAQNKLNDIINEHNSIIFDEQNWIGKDLRKIAEVTYSYNDNTNINTTLFVSWGWLDLELYKNSWKKERKKLLLTAKDNLIELLNEKKEQIKSALWELELIDLMNGDSVNINIKSIFINSLNEKSDFLDYCLNAIPFEIEKAWFKLKLSNKEETDTEKKQAQLDSKLFWWEIKNNSEETMLSYEYIIEKYNTNKNKLNSRQQERFEWYLERIVSFLPEWYKYKEKEKPKLISWDFLEYDIPRKDYMTWFNMFVEALEKLEHIVESNKNVWSISDWPKWVQFPTTKKFDSIKILRFLKLSLHEIETHNITDYNWRQIIWNLRGANSTEKDEWVAILMEQLFMYWKELYKTDKDWDQIIDITKLDLVSNFVQTLAWEVLNSKELLDYLNLSEKIDPDIISPNDRFLRLKRNNKAWVQHKDTTYTRWLFKAVEEINKYIKSKWKEWIAPEDLFLGKISFEETWKLKQIKESKEKEIKKDIVMDDILLQVNASLEKHSTHKTKKTKKKEKTNTIKPLFLSDAVYFIVTEKLKWEEWNIDSKHFYKYLKDKYPIFDFTLKEIEEISFKTKRNVYAIVNIILKTIWQHQINKLTKNNKKHVKNILKSLTEPYNHKINHAKEKLHPERRKAK